MELENDIDLFFSCGNLLIDPGCQALDSGPGLTLHVGGEGVVAVLEAAHHHPGARLDDGLAVDTQEHVHLDTVP